MATNIRTVEARKWFPCWDEPQFKTTFHFRFNHKKQFKLWPTLSKGFSTEQDKGDWIWTTFVIPDLIPTYQVMFLLTDLYCDKKYVYRTTSNQTDKSFHTIRSRPIVGDSMAFSDHVIEMILDSEWYRKIPGNIQSVNHLAIPAMQDDVIGKWRIILYKESLVTYDEEIDSRTHKREVASTVARGIVNQAIDNAVTPLWWSDLWFNKGLATILHLQLLNETFPKLRFTDLFVVQVQQDCLRLDTNFTMKPLSYEVQKSSEIKSLFSFPIYVKAPVILRMIQHILGNKFPEVIKQYTQIIRNTEFSYYEPVGPNYLWDMMQVHMFCGLIDVIDHPKLYQLTMKDIMETWLTRNNHPIVHVSRNGSMLFIRQSETQHYIDDKGNAQVLRHWLPITFTTWKDLDFNNTTPHHWLTPEDSSKISVQLTSDEGWIILNLQQTGYYRVKYDKESLEMITNYLRYDKFKKIHVVNRAQIIDDTYYFLKRGEVTYNQFINLIDYLSREGDYVAWYPLFQIFRDISYFIPFAESRTLKADMRFIIEDLPQSLTYDELSGEDDLIKWLRQEVVRWACIFGDTKCQRIATDKLEEHIEAPQKYKLSPEWRQWIYCKGAMRANRNVLLKLEKLSHIDDYEIFDYLSCVEKPRFAINIFYNSSLERNNYPISFRYAIFVDYAVENINEITSIIETHNAPASDKTKLVFIIINHLFTKIKFKQMISNLSKYRYKKSETSEIFNNLWGVVKKRLRQIKYQKQRLMKLKNS